MKVIKGEVVGKIIESLVFILLSLLAFFLANTIAIKNVVVISFCFFLADSTNIFKKENFPNTNNLILWFGKTVLISLAFLLIKFYWVI